ncbi:hypothetical protein EZS27_006626, partial [termite gut metagenome]
MQNKLRQVRHLSAKVLGLIRS